MSPQELIHSINNQLTIVMGRADLLSHAQVNEETQHVCLEIRKAAGKLNHLLRQYMDISQSNHANMKAAIPPGNNLPTTPRKY
ncbi:MAG TPA: hypothetical protein VFP59_17535 [Candidatus Angelobacter sp.]|nr:hypothetical protein [Candidatus Angelobacter sp.]